MGSGARVTVEGGGAPTALDALLSAVCARSRAPARRSAASVCVYLYRNTAFGFPYSPATQISEGLTQRYTFQGREASAHSAAGAPMYYRNRQYSPALGRFGRRDPMLGGDPLFNAYGFPGATSPNHRDPLGSELRVPEGVASEIESELNMIGIWASTMLTEVEIPDGVERYMLFRGKVMARPQGQRTRDVFIVESEKMFARAGGGSVRMQVGVYRRISEAVGLDVVSLSVQAAMSNLITAPDTIDVCTREKLVDALNEARRVAEEDRVRSSDVRSELRDALRAFKAANGDVESQLEARSQDSRRMSELLAQAHPIQVPKEDTPPEEYVRTLLDTAAMGGHAVAPDELSTEESSRKARKKASGRTRWEARGAATRAADEHYKTMIENYSSIIVEGRQLYEGLGTRERWLEQRNSSANQASALREMARRGGEHPSADPEKIIDSAIRDPGPRVDYEELDAARQRLEKARAAIDTFQPRDLTGVLRRQLTAPSSAATSQAK